MPREIEGKREKEAVRGGEMKLVGIQPKIEELHTKS